MTLTGFKTVKFIPIKSLIWSLKNFYMQIFAMDKPNCADLWKHEESKLEEAILASCCTIHLTSSVEVKTVPQIAFCTQSMVRRRRTLLWRICTLVIFKALKRISWLVFQIQAESRRSCTLNQSWLNVLPVFWTSFTSRASHRVEVAGYPNQGIL